jgi:hypothetical protein
MIRQCLRKTLTTRTLCIARLRKRRELSSSAGFSGNYQKIDGSELAIDGSVSNEQIQYLAKEYKGVLYVASDSGSDVGAVNGFKGLQAAFPAENAAQHIPIVATMPAFSTSLDQFPIIPAINLYKQIETALDSLPKPAVIVCASNTRASMIVAAYLVCWLAIAYREQNITTYLLCRESRMDSRYHKLSKDRLHQVVCC